MPDSSIAQPDVEPATCRVLIVDDEQAICRVLERYLGRQQYEVHTAGSAAAALVLLQRIRFSVMISDVGLPDGSGLDLVRQAREIEPHLAVVVYSGRAEPGTQKSAVENGATEFLMKPVPLHDFLLAVQRVEARRLKEIELASAGATRATARTPDARATDRSSDEQRAT
jgi:DNA-binding NtrC family response regulator